MQDSAAIKEGSHHSRSEHEAIRVLIVDDDPAFRALCLGLLKQQRSAGYEVVEVGTAQDAVHACLSAQFDCILIDYGLPEMHGTDLIDRLRPRVDAFVPMIILTSAGSEDIVVESMHSGAADYLPKHNVNAASLNRVISGSVEKAGLRRSVEDRTQRLLDAMSELEKRNYELRRFYHTVSHELKTPLMSAREFASLLADGVMGEMTEPQREALNHVLESCDDIARHFDALTEVSRADAGQPALARQRVSVESIIDRCVSGAFPAAAQKRITLERLDFEQLPDIEVDGFRVSQAVGNLIANAIEHSEERGRVNICAEQIEDGWVCIVVQDFGRGIAPESLPNIFDRLWQADAAEQTAHGGRGLGLGLSIAREIIELHGGRIDVESQIDIGSTFSVHLPINAAE